MQKMLAPGMLATAATLLLLVAGCTNDRNQIPASAQMVASGDEHLAYQAPHDGTVYVYNDHSHKMVYSGDVKKGQTLDVDLKHNVITVDGRTVLRHDLAHGSEHQVYFMRSPLTDREPDVVIEKHTSIDHNPDVIVHERTASDRQGDVTVQERTTDANGNVIIKKKTTVTPSDTDSDVTVKKETTEIHHD